MAAGKQGASRWLIYALGGGSGHLVRSLALGRAAARRGHRVRILTNSPLASRFHRDRFPGEMPASVSVTRVPSDWDAAAIRDFSARLLQLAAYDLLVVDTFPRGLAGELPRLFGSVHVPRVLVHRDLNPAYVARYGIHDWVAEQFGLVLLPGECGPLSGLPRAVRTGPWLLLDSHELPPEAAARRLLGIADEWTGPVLLVSGSGKPDEWRRSAALAERLRNVHGKSVQVRFACLEPSLGQPLLQVWPLLSVLRAVDVLVGGGGYNSVHEARAAGVPLLAIPQPRRYDRQAVRLRSEEQVQPDELPRRIERLLAEPRRLRCAPVYDNGVHEAVERIERLEGDPSAATRGP